MLRQTEPAAAFSADRNWANTTAKKKKESPRTD